MKKIISFIGVLVLCPLMIGCSNNNESSVKEQPEKETTKFKVVTHDQIAYRNSSFEVNEEGTTIVTEVENKDSVAREINVITLELKDKDGNVIDTLTSYVGQKIEPGDSVATVAITGVDLSKTAIIDYGAQ